MMVFAGLGNPGEKYKNTRHNIGFLVLDEFAEKNNFPEFEIKKFFNSAVSEKILNNEGIILAKPLTFMNRCGESLKKLRDEYKIKNEDLFLVHDDIDLPLGKIRISKSRGAAGHKGVESAIKELKTKSFTRLRIGIRPKAGKPKNTERFVIKSFLRDEEETKKEVIKKSGKALEAIISQGTEKAMNEYNK